VADPGCSSLSCPIVRGAPGAKRTFSRGRVRPGETLRNFSFERGMLQSSFFLFFFVVCVWGVIRAVTIIGDNHLRKVTGWVCVCVYLCVCVSE